MMHGQKKHQVNWLS